MVRRLIIHLVAAFGISLYGSPVSVSIPNMNIPRSDTVNIPIKAVGVVSSDSLIAYQAVVVFSSSIVQGVDAFKTGTMTQNWDDPVVGIKTDTLRLAGITTNQPDKRWVANDTLIKLRFIVLGELDAKTTIRIFDIKLFNINGAITISSKTDGQMTVIPNPLSRTVNIDLYSNWNLVSFSLSPVPNTLPEAFGGIPVGFVFSYISGIGPKTWDSVRPGFLNDLKSVDGLHGYWMKLNSPTLRILTLAGILVSVNTPLLLNSGWNLISYLPESRDSLSHAFSSLGKAYRFVSGYQANGIGTQTWDRGRPAFLNDLKVLNPTLGYWVKMDTAKILIYPSSGYILPKLPAWHDKESTPRKVQSTSQWCDFWAYQPELFVPGDTVKVFDMDGMLCGETPISPEKAFIVHVNGDDPLTQEIGEGASEGDTLRFEIGGKKMRVVGTSLTTPDTAILIGRFAIWENMASKYVQLAEEINLVPETSKPIAEKSFELFQNHPNPFNSQTLIRYQAPNAGPIKLTLFDTKGRVIVQWIREYAPAGSDQVIWDGHNERGFIVSSGIYLYRLEAGGQVLTRKCLFVK